MVIAFPNISDLTLLITNDCDYLIIDSDCNEYGRMNFETFVPTAEEVKDLWQQALDKYYPAEVYCAEQYKELEMNALLKSEFFQQLLEEDARNG